MASNTKCVSRKANCIDLFSRYGHKYLVTFAPPNGVRARDPWLAQLVCQHGHFYPHGGNELGFATDKNGAIANRLRELPFVTVAQDGDDGVNIVFHVDHFTKIAKIVKPRSRRRLSKKQKAAMAEGHAKFLEKNPDWRPGQRVDRDEPIAEDEKSARRRTQPESGDSEVKGANAERQRRQKSYDWDQDSAGREGHE